uniref:hypothetical protein n=1 Tax=Rhodella violacea TaxID=2801 RepID=UPI001FCDBB89|nr:hypothetical protein MW504_pgp120 [Rhodella violacea]UNJ18056.1 hypothetical protein [Rhodella violacea]
MSGFWQNTVQFIRFFLSSVLGLVLAILNPILFFTKKTKKSSLVIIPIIMISFFLILGLILQSMLGLDT